MLVPLHCVLVPGQIDIRPGMLFSVGGVCIRVVCECMPASGCSCLSVPEKCLAGEENVFSQFLK